jgi:hypothetical protein
MTIRLGEILVQDGLLTEAQRLEVMEAQKTGARPFGLLAEELFGLSAKSIEQAWAKQFSDIADWIDPLDAQVAANALATIERRQAWQFRCLPLWFDRRELLLATDTASLPRAMRFVGWRVPDPCRFLLATPEALTNALQAYYPMGIDDEVLDLLSRNARA